ncbi:LysM peptidoglycan-binding domain-containing protein [Lysobacter pythonis]|uniref:Potassium binding protein Kbp n=1 Tax=Solilutibacter pythonis TaxID=2483112 RepID=A0A3M2I2Y3_9GAMM|nr:LysM and BON domain-containing protein [Lysobacter pythonis]RMH94503.1 LysM peptidoglycan-binding domain-containing protein [Lysobacter pythonis]
MGIFDFIKNAGEKIFKPGEAKAEDAIVKHINSYGLDISGLKVEVDGGTAAIEGQARDIATRERAVLVAGNVDGIEKVDDRMTVAAAAAAVSGGTDFSAVTGGSSATVGTGGGEWSSRTYTVQKGDTLSKIAKEMYGDASKYPAIFEANKPMLKDPDKIYPGQVLRIPADN